MNAMQYILYGIIVVSVLPVLIVNLLGAAVRTRNKALQIALIGVGVGSIGSLILAITEGNTFLILPAVTLALTLFFAIRILVRAQRNYPRVDGNSSPATASRATTFDVYAAIVLGIASVVFVIAAVFIPLFIR